MYLRIRTHTLLEEFKMSSALVVYVPASMYLPRPVRMSAAQRLKYRLANPKNDGMDDARLRWLQICASREQKVPSLPSSVPSYQAPKRYGKTAMLGSILEMMDYVLEVERHGLA